VQPESLTEKGIDVRTAITGLAVMAAVPAAFAGGFNINYLVPAFVQCPGPDTCGAPQRESRFRFESAVLRSARSRYLNLSKPTLLIELKGVTDENGVPVTSDAFTVRVESGQVNLVGISLTIPAGHPLAQVPPVSIPIRNGNGKLSYKAAAANQAPAGTIVEGGGAVIYDSDGKRLATVGTQTK